jgi:hypothetical protein
MYPLYRYGADEILLWPRIYHVLPRELLSDIEDARASLEFLLVVSLWCVGFAIGNPVVAVLDHGSASLASWMFVIGIFSGYLAYSSAIPAAAEYGEYLRSAFEAYRFNLLAQLRAPAPEDLTAERRLWNGLGAFLLNGAYLAWRYETDGNERLTRSEDLQSYHGGEGA